VEAAVRFILFCLLLSVAFAACDGDDDDDETPTSTPAASTPVTTPSADPAIVIETPAEGDTVTTPVEMTGIANVFEAVLFIDAVLSDDTVLCSRRLMATSGTGTPGDWNGILAFAAPSEDTAVSLRGFSLSAMDGSVINLVEREVTVSAEQPDIVIDEPACRAEVTGPTLAVSGEAQVFEAALTVELRDEAGVAVITQQVMAASGTERSPWSTTFDLGAVTPGFYDVVAYSISAMDGSVINEFPVQISVSP
jgi:hypothetical protein